MKASQAQVALCSTCGATLTPKGECLPCLVHLGFDESLEQVTSPIFGEYEIARREDGSFWELGRGAMGVTYRAEDKALNRTVALKIIETPAGASAGELIRDRFLREARAAAALRHPNVAGVFQFGTSPEGSRCYYAMELVEGETLEALVRRDGPLKVEAAVEMAVQVTRALVAAAAHGLIHRDLKPGNIMLTQSASDVEVKVIDFGLAKAIAANGDEMDLTQGAFIGTPAFASPEQFRSAPADARSDIYSLGVTLWYALTAEVPYEGRSIEEIRRSQSEIPLPLDKLAARRVPKPVIQLLSRILSLDPAQRPASARDLMELLESSRPRRGGAAFEGHSVRQTSLKVAALVVVVGVAAALFFVFRRASDKAPPVAGAPAKSIAVLPFVDISQAKDQAYLCEGISEEILNALAQVEGLRVAARTSSFAFEGKNADIGEVATKLNVENVLEGSLRREGNRIRITVQLINARDGFHIWSETFDRELQGVFAVQDEITRSIMDALRIKLALAPAASSGRDTEAYDLYLRGLYFSNKSGKKDLRKSLSLFQRALDKDPNFARAWTGVAKVWLYLADAYVKPLEAYPVAEAAAGNALRLNERDAEAHCFLGHAKEVLEWDEERMFKETSRALEIDPNSSIAHVWLGDVFLRYRGDAKSALAEFRKAVQLDPLSAIVADALCGASVMIGDLDEAIAQGKRTLELDPNYTYLDSNLANAYREKGRFSEAIELYLQGEQSTQSPSGGLAITYARAGRVADAEHKLLQLLERRKTHYVPASTIAYVYAALANKDEAFVWLERACTEHDASLTTMGFYPGSQPLRDDPRFVDLIRRIGLDPAKAISRSAPSP